MNVFFEYFKNTNYESQYSLNILTLSTLTTTKNLLLLDSIINHEINQVNAAKHLFYQQGLIFPWGLNQDPIDSQNSY